MVELKNLAAQAMEQEANNEIYRYFTNRKEYQINKRFTAQQGEKVAGLFCLPESDGAKESVVAKRSDGPQKAIENAGRAFQRLMGRRFKIKNGVSLEDDA
jgi:hypothetical protein